MATAIATSGRLANKVAIVTGSSSGIGRAIAIAYAREGAKVVCSDVQPHSRSETGAHSQEATHELIANSGGTSTFIQVDIANPEKVELLIAETLKRFGRLDIMVNNAGLCPEAENSTATPINQPIHLTPLSTYDKTMDVNARGTFICCKFSIAQMMKQDPLPSGERGWVINIASIAGLVGFAGIPYSFSKGAIVSLTRQVAFDYGKHKIHVNAICPGTIKTPMLGLVSSNDPVRAGVETQTPWNSLGEPKHIAGAAVFFASEDAAFVTGSILSVDGGYTVH